MAGPKDTKRSKRGDSKSKDKSGRKSKAKGRKSAPKKATAKKATPRRWDFSARDAMVAAALMMIVGLVALQRIPESLAATAIQAVSRVFAPEAKPQPPQLPPPGGR